jgi:hypothetical protein
MRDKKVLCILILVGMILYLLGAYQTYREGQNQVYQQGVQYGYVVENDGQYQWLTQKQFVWKYLEEVGYASHAIPFRNNLDIPPPPKKGD